MPAKKSQKGQEGLRTLFGPDSSFSNMTPVEVDLFTKILQEEYARREKAGKPEQIQEIMPIEQWVNSTYMIGEDADKIYPYWKNLIIDIFRSDRKDKVNSVILSGCFTGDTRISLLDGRELSFTEIIKEFGTSPFWVYSLDDEGNIVPGRAFNAHKTKTSDDLVCVTLNNGEKIRCTSDHLFRMRNGVYKRASELKPGDPLSPLYRDYEKGGSKDLCPNGYERVYNYKNRTVKSVERLHVPEDVYDIEVDKYHNFALSAGVFVHNSVGVGKSTAAEIIMLRKLYELSCFRNINAMFHLMSKTNIVFLYLTVSKQQAVSTGFGEFRSLVDHSPYFNTSFRRRERLDSLLVFPEGLTVAYGSRSSDAIGMSVISAILDEANFIAGNGNNTTGNTERALDMYAGLVNRANSRFIIDGGENHSLNILVSSATHESSATEKQISMSRGDPHTVIAAPSQWEVKPDKFSKRFFWVLKGTNYLEPEIVRSVDDINAVLASEGFPQVKYQDGVSDYVTLTKVIEGLPPRIKGYFLSVPEDLRQGFEINIVRSLQDLGGVSVGSTGKLFSSPAVLDSCIDNEHFKHPFVAQEFVVATGDQVEVKDYVMQGYALKYPERPRYIHIDQSTTTDSTGISSVFVYDIMEDPETRMKKPIIGVDFMLRINPPKPPRKIAIYKIRNFVVWLSTSLGMKINRVSYDIFNSEESRQILEEMGFSVGYQSVDRTDKEYLDLVEIMYEGRIKMYEYPILRYELLNLIHYRDRHKVDHPKVVNDSDYSGKGQGTGSKDVADSLCLSGDTEVRLVSGESVTMERLYDECQNLHGSRGKVFAYDAQRGETTVATITRAAITGNPELLLRIHLSNGNHVDATESHLLLMDDGAYKEAGRLEVGDLLKAFDASEPVQVTGLEAMGNHGKPVYDLTLDRVHNFALSAGVFAHNCGAVANLLKDSLQGAEGFTGRGLEDFMEANKVNTLWEPDKMTADDMLDKVIDDYIESMEYAVPMGGFGMF